MFKKALSLVVSLMLMVTSLSFAAVNASAADTEYVVAGVEELCGVSWKGSPVDAPANVMTDNGDGTYTKVFTDVQPATALQLKVVENGADGSQNWIGDSTGNNITFNVTVACDVTVNYDPSTKEITVTGDGVQFVTNLDIKSMHAVGNGDGAWLDDANWDPTANEMTKVADNVYEITYKNVEEFDNYQVKFAANGTWADSWGGAEENFTPESGVEFDAAYNGQNLTVNVPYATADVTLRIDLTNFDYATKTGAKATVTVKNTAEEPTEPTTEVVTTAPETEPEETTEPTTAPASGLTVKATSNYFPETVYKVSEDQKTITVTYFIQADMNMVNAEWYLTYDPAVLKVETANNFDGENLTFMPAVKSGGVYNTAIAGKVNGNASTITYPLYKIANRTPFVSVTFTVIGEGETTVDLNTRVITLGTAKLDDMLLDPDTMTSVVREYVVGEGNSHVTATDTVIYAGGLDWNATNPVETVATTAPVTEPETSEPVTEPATEPETTQPVTEPVTEPATDPTPAGSTYVVAGSEELCGVSWKGSPADAPANVMTDNGDGTFTKVFTNVQPATALQLKVVENTAEGAQNWIGDETGNNVTFNVTAACDVTVTYDTATGKITVTGDGVQFVTDLDIQSMHAVGNGDGAWLNDANWDPTANEMTQVADKVYEITFSGVEEFANYQVKFAANGTWADSWGGAVENFTPESGVEFDAAYNGENLTVNVPYATADVTLRIDLTNFDYATKTGAKATVTVTDTSEPATEAVTTEPTTAPATTLTVNATSNLFPASSQVIAEDEEYVTVTYYFQSEKQILNADFMLTYNPEMLALDSVITPYTNGVVVNSENAGVVNGNMSSLTLYNFDQKTPFVSAVFKKLAVGETEVNLKVSNLTLSLPTAAGTTDESQEEGLVRDGVVSNTSTQYTVETEVKAGKYTPDLPTTAPVTEPETTTEPTTEPAPAGSTYVVAGSEELCGVAWKGSPADAPENVMTDNGDGTFTKVFTDVEPATALQLKVVENTAEGVQNWIGDETGNNVTFNVVTPCDVTVTYDSNTGKITVSGDGVEFISDIDIRSMHAVGNGDGAWLNDANWDPTANEMTQIADKVYEITFSGVEAFENYQVKFAANGTWADSWGGAEENFTPESGVEFDAAYNGQNLVVNVPYETADVTLRIDLTNFDYATKTGAKATVTITDASEEPTTEPITQPTTATEPTSEPVTQPTTVTEPTTQPTTVTEPTSEPVTEPTKATDPATTVDPDSTVTPDATSATGATVKPGTADTANNGNNTTNNGNGTVKTGNASMAVVILLVLVSATGVIYFTRKKIK